MNQNLVSCFRYDQDCELLWMDTEVSRPENMILQRLLVPPVCIRPSVAMDGGRYLRDIIDLRIPVFMIYSAATRTM